MNIESLTKCFGDDRKPETSLWSFSHVVFVPEKNDARSSKKELQMKAELKTLTKPPKLTLVFRNHLTDYSAWSAIANVLWMFFKHILILLGGQQSECSIHQNWYYHEGLKPWWRQVSESFFQSTFHRMALEVLILEITTVFGLVQIRYPAQAKNFTN